MEMAFSWIVLAVILLAGGTHIYMIIRGHDPGAYWLEGYAGAKEALVPLPKPHKQILTQYFDYYNQLSFPDQLKFEKKLQRFLTSKVFIPRGFQQVTREMKVLISACAIQLTFGFPHVYLSHFRRILIYLDSYYSTINKKYHKGEVNPMYGIIVISWSSFAEGYIDHRDSSNLGLHEMAHALRLENLIRNHEYQFFDEGLLQQWEKLAGREMKTVNEGKHTFFRAYAGTDGEEFFAVAVESFFERTREFQDKLPELYAVLSGLLRQDPLTMINPTHA